MNCAGSIGGIAVPIATGTILRATGTSGAVLGFFALCAAVYVAGTLTIDDAPMPARAGAVS